MPIIAKDNGGGDFTPIPQGTHVAICNLVADLGVQGGGRFKPQRKVYIRFEVPAERLTYEKDGSRFEGPMQIGRTYTLSLSEKAHLRRDLVAWRGRQFTPEELAGFDIGKLVGAPCQITVAHEAGADSKTYAGIIAISGLPKGALKPRAEKPLVVYPDMPGSFDLLPGWLQEKIRAAVPEDLGPSSAATELEFDDDIPF